MALIKCKECGHEVSDKASACPNCGCPIEKGLVCDECGASISETDEMCPNCGNPIKSKNGFNWKKPILFLVILLFVLGGTYGIWQLMGSIDERRGDVEITAELSEAVHRYDEVSNFHEGLSAVCKNDKWGYINSKGEEVIPCKYEYSCDFSEGLACVYLTRDDNMPIAFIDNNGNTVISGYYGGSRFGRLKFKNGKCLVVDKDKNDFYIDKEGNRTDEPNNIENGSDEMPDVEIFYDNDKMGVKDTLGNIIVQAKYSYIDDFSEGLAVAYLYCSDDKNIYGFVDKKGNDTFTESDFAQLSEYEKQRQEEAKRAEEERLRQEEEIRRQGVEKVVSITIERNNRSIVNYSGNYGATKYSGMWEYFDYAITNFIRIPNGKVWIFKRTKVSESGLWSLRLFYYPKERGNSGVNSFDDAYKLPGNPPVLRAGDGFRIAAESLNEGVATVEVYFSEKDEEYYY